MRRVIVLISILVVAVFASTVLADGEAGSKIEFVTKAAFELDKSPYLVLVFCDEETCANNIAVFEQLNDLMQISTELGDTVVVKATKDAALKQFYGVVKAPKVFFFREGHYVAYQGNLVLNALSEWIELTKEKLTRSLDDTSFEHLTQAATGATTGDWFVLFYKTDCKTFLYVQPNWEAAAITLKGRTNFAYVNLEKSPKLQERFGIFNSPTIYYFKQGLMYRYDIDKLDHDSLVAFVDKSWYKNFKAERVPFEPSWFDQLIDSIVAEIKKNPSYIYIFFGLLFITGCGIVFTVFFSSNKPKGGRRQDYDKSD